MYNEHPVDGGTFEDSTPYELGAQACKDGKSVFDYPYLTSDPETEEWIDGYVSQDRKKYA
jgi:hypothetical protein